MSDSLTEQQVAELPVHLEDDQVEEGAAPTSARAGLFRFARMTGSSIAGRDAAGWVTDFFNAAYYRRSVRERDVDDLRLAFCVLTTYWYRNLLRNHSVGVLAELDRVRGARPHHVAAQRDTPRLGRSPEAPFELGPQIEQPSFTASHLFPGLPR